MCYFFTSVSCLAMKEHLSLCIAKEHDGVSSVVEANIVLCSRVNFVKYHYENTFNVLQYTLKEVHCIIFKGKYNFSDDKYISIKV